MKIRQTRDREQLAAFFRRDPALHAYALGDLDPFFFDNTRWWVASEGGEILAALLLYTGFQTPTILALSDNHAQGAIWEQVLPELPDRAYVHFRAPHALILQRRYQLQRGGTHHKMVWAATDLAFDIPTHGLRRLTDDDLPAIRSLYASTFPQAHFDPRTLQLGKTFGWIEKQQLISIAATHVYSPQYSVAAIGAVATHPAHRARGLAGAVTGALTRDMAEEVKSIGLNVHGKNDAAIRVYQRIGYRKCHEYEEATLTC